jgi:hypothetical protein
VERADQPERRQLAVDRAEQHTDVVLVEAAQGEVRDRVAALEPGQQLGGRVAPRQPVGPVGADQQQAAAVGLGQLLEDAEALGVGPVEVFEHEQAGAHRHQLADHRDRGCDASVGRAVDVAHDGQQVGVDPLDPVDPLEAVGVHGRAEALERIDDQRQRPARRGLLGLAADHHRLGRQPGHQLLDQAGLADAGLTGDERDRRKPTCIEQIDQAIELGRPTHHDGGQSGPSHEHGPEGKGPV